MISCNKKDSNDNYDIVGLWKSSKADTLIQLDVDTLFQYSADTIWKHNYSSEKSSGVNKNFTLNLMPDSSYLLIQNNDTTLGKWIQFKTDSLKLKIKRGRYYFDLKIGLTDNYNLTLSYRYETLSAIPVICSNALIEERKDYYLKIFYQRK
jgi:hypothetical protein